MEALQLVQAPLQFGGHEQVSIEVAHLVVRNAQQISKARKRSCSMIFADLRSAFFTVAKPFLTGALSGHGPAAGCFGGLCGSY